MLITHIGGLMTLITAHEPPSRVLRVPDFGFRL